MLKSTLLAIVALLAFVPLASAQVPVVQYRITRTAPAQAPNILVLSKATFTCNALESAIPQQPGVSLQDPDNPTRVCFLAANGNWTGLTPGVAYSFTAAAAGSSGVWSAESAAVTLGVPQAPNGFGLRPGFTGIAMLGTVDFRFPFQLPNGPMIDVASSRLDDTGEVIHVGMGSLRAPGFNVRAGDKIQVALWR